MQGVKEYDFVGVGSMFGVGSMVYGGCYPVAHARQHLVWGSAFKNNYFTEMCSGSEEGSYLRLCVSLNARYLAVLLLLLEREIEIERERVRTRERERQRQRERERERERETDRQRASAPGGTAPPPRAAGCRSRAPSETQHAITNTETQTPLLIP